MSTENGSAIALASRPLATLSDDALLHQLTRILTRSRRVEADLVAHIAEVDERRLWAREAFPSMFAYCTRALRLSEAEAYLRITAARASLEHPAILPMLGDGRLHLTGICLLVPHLTRENCEALLRRATHRSKREVEQILAELAPRPDVPALMRKLPEPASPTLAQGVAGTMRSAGPSPRDGAGAAADPRTPSGMGSAVTPLPASQPAALESANAPSLESEPDPPLAQPLARPVAADRGFVEPLAPGRYRVQFTASAGLHRKLERLRALMRPQVPDGDLGVVIGAAVTEKLERLEARRFGATSRPRAAQPVPVPSNSDPSPASRHVPASVRRAVRTRDGDRCRYVDAPGRRCEERDRLEYHHRRPFGFGGEPRAENVALMCRAHNLYLAEHDYGREAMARFRGRARAGSPVPASIGDLGRSAPIGSSVRPAPGKQGPATRAGPE